ncbi:MAG: TRAP transporter TatT component family protein [Acidobacteriota bacterium]
MKRFALVSAIFVFIASQVSAQETGTAKADKLFAARDNVESLKQGASLVEDVTKREPASFEAFWRLARFRYYLADHEKDGSKKGKVLQSAMDAGKKAIELDPARVEGHFWLAAATGEYADLKGALQSLTLVKTVRREFEAALAINPAYENGDIYSALGQIDLNLPKLFGGNERRGLERLEAGLKVGANNSDLKVTLAEYYIKKGRNDEARALLESVLSASDLARSLLEQEDIKAKARRLLEKLK